jgi:hypothetical protein
LEDDSDGEVTRVQCGGATSALAVASFGQSGKLFKSSRQLQGQRLSLRKCVFLWEIEGSREDEARSKVSLISCQHLGGPWITLRRANFRHLEVDETKISATTEHCWQG